MNNEPLMLQHPVDRLELYDLEPEKWDWKNPPELYLVDDSMLVPPFPYMSPLSSVEVEGKESIEFIDDGRCRYRFKLTCEVNELWQSIFQKHRSNVDVAVDQNLLVLCCDPKDLEKSYDMICHSSIYKTTNDYCTERRKLVWQVLEKMERQEFRDRVTTEIQDELNNYWRQRRERSLVAQQNGWSISFVIQNFNEHFREILENKFAWWAKVLDYTTVRECRAKFEMALLVV